jgi:hypothetical protein
MADGTFVVDTIASLDEAAPKALGARSRPSGDERMVAIRFSGGRSGVLDVSKSPGSVWASVLRNLHEMSQPAYVEIDPETSLIRQVLQPKLQPVGNIEAIERGGDMRIDLLNSHAVHFLRRTHPRYAALLRLLRDAHKKSFLVWVTETLNTHEIIDVRPAQSTNE